MEQSLSRNNFEIIVVNDASSDQSAHILNNYKDEARLFNLDQNLGLAGARNYGLQKARGQFVVFLDADDYIHRDLLWVETLFLNENNSIDAVSCDYYLVDERGKHLRHVNAVEEPIACGIMFRKDFLFDIGLYDEGFRAREEEDLRIRWTGKYNIHNLNIPLYRYRQHENNLTKDEETMRKYSGLLNTKHK
jgi:glycosyltransferase involved in cell wall biosynthesis